MIKSIAVLQLCIVMTWPVISAAAIPKFPDWYPDEDRKAYELLMSQYQKQDLKRLTAYEKIFAQKFQTSPLKDNATYLVAQLLMEQKKWREAIPPLTRIIKQDVLSERWPSAVYARGLAYFNLGMKREASKQWNVLVKRFPGSRESQQAWVNLRLMEPGKKKN